MRAAHVSQPSPGSATRTKTDAAKAPIRTTRLGRHSLRFVYARRKRRRRASPRRFSAQTTAVERPDTTTDQAATY
jgi:hypothetical protein